MSKALCTNCQQFKDSTRLVRDAKGKPRLLCDVCKQAQEPKPWERKGSK